MKRRIVLKRLSASDLTLFEHHFRITPGAKQKAFNLDRMILVNRLYPGLPDGMDVTKDRIPLDLSIYGPGRAGLHNIQRKILKQQKNWRLDGEYIYNPPGEEARYNPLQKGDFAIIEFSGDSVPRAARMYLVAQAVPEDSDLHRALEERYSSAFSSRKGMEEVDLEELAGLLGEVKLEDGHPVLDLIDADSLEDAAQGGVEGIRKLRKRRKARGVGRDEFDKAKQNAEQTGRTGEELVNSWLEGEKANGHIPDYQWDSSNNAISPYDFSIVDAVNIIRKIDAKATVGEFQNPIHVSFAELEEMAHSDIPYDIFRLYSVKQNSAKMRIAENTKEFARTVLDSLKGLPEGVRVDGISFNPDKLDFKGEIIVTLIEPAGEDEPSDPDE